MVIYAMLAYNYIYIYIFYLMVKYKVNLYIIIINLMNCIGTDQRGLEVLI
jgi:hypothetical protein